MSTNELRKIDVCAFCAETSPPPELAMTCERAHVHYLHAKCHEKHLRDFQKSLGRHLRIRPACCIVKSCGAKTSTRALSPEDFLTAREIDRVMSTAHQLASETPLMLSACVKISRSASGDWKDALARARHRGAVDARGVGVCAGDLPSAGESDDDDDNPDRCVGTRRDGTRCAKLAQRGGELCARCHEAKAVLKRLAGKENATQTAAPKKRAAGAAAARARAHTSAAAACPRSQRTCPRLPTLPEKPTDARRYGHALRQRDLGTSQGGRHLTRRIWQGPRTNPQRRRWRPAAAPYRGPAHPDLRVQRCPQHTRPAPPTQ